MLHQSRSKGLWVLPRLNPRLFQDMGFIYFTSIYTFKRLLFFVSDARTASQIITYLFLLETSKQQSSLYLLFLKRLTYSWFPYAILPKRSNRQNNRLLRAKFNAFSHNIFRELLTFVCRFCWSTVKVSEGEMFQDSHRKRSRKRDTLDGWGSRRSWMMLQGYIMRHGGEWTYSLKSHIVNKYLINCWAQKRYWKTSFST